MKDAVARAIARMRDPDWFRERCARAPIVQRHIYDVASRAGLSLRPFKAVKPGPAFAMTVAFDEFRNAELIMESRVTFFGYVTADVFRLTHHVQIANAAPAEMRLDPFLDARLREPPTKQAAQAEDAVVSAFRELGWEEISWEEAMEQVPTRKFEMSVVGALEGDLFGWLDGEPVPDRLPADLVPYRDMVANLHGDPEAIVDRARSSASWERPVERVLLGYGRVQRLTPVNYPSVAWTIDFGDVTNGTFHARFLTDIYASKIAPVWFWTHRFIVDNQHHEALSRLLEGWTVQEIGYTWPQQRALEDVRRLLADQNLTELEPYFPRSLVSPTADPSELRTLNEWLFRDPRGLTDPAPRLEEEHPDREVRVRRGGLRD